MSTINPFLAHLQDPTRLLFIAEIGINHNGDEELLLQMIRAAKESGADAVKLQKRSVGEVYSEDYLAAPRSSPFGETQRTLKEGLELSRAAYERALELCSSLGLLFFFSPWDEESVAFGEALGIEAYKVASPSLHDHGLLRRLAATGKPMFISTGMSDGKKLREALELLSPCPQVIMHCISAYPTQDADCRLAQIGELIDRYPQALAVGYSGHERDILPSVLSVGAGARVIERHFTTSRTLWGSDQGLSLEPAEFKLMTEQARRARLLMGQGLPARKVLLCEISAMRKLERNRKIDLVVSDVDGVITDGTVTLTADGAESKIIGYRELDALGRMIGSGYRVYLVSKEQNALLARRLAVIEGLELRFGCSDKLEAVRAIAAAEKVGLDRVCYIGDSFSDVEPAQAAGLSLCPADAVPEMRRVAALGLRNEGGKGVLAEALELIATINAHRSFAINESLAGLGLLSNAA